MEEKIPTKKLILLKALDLFSERGYEGVSVDQIGEAVGIKGPSLYRHYKGKQDIFDTLINEMDVAYHKNMEYAGQNITIPGSGAELEEFTMKKLQYTMHDSNIRKCRKVLTLEQYRDRKLADILTEHNYLDMVGLYANVFAEMIKIGVLRSEDTKLMAIQFVAPISVMVQQYDRFPEKEAEILEKIKAHIHQFAKIYGTQSEQ